jgi:hypothetical protein
MKLATVACVAPPGASRLRPIVGRLGRYRSSDRGAKAVSAASRITVPHGVALATVSAPAIVELLLSESFAVTVSSHRD